MKTKVIIYILIIFTNRIVELQLMSKFISFFQKELVKAQDSVISEVSARKLVTFLHTLPEPTDQFQRN